MNPSAPTKPVMDVAAPKNPALTPNLSPRPMATTQTAALPVRPAPLVSAAPAAGQPAVPANPLPWRAQQVAAKSKPAPRPQTTHRAPVALITVTVFVMLVLSVLAFTVYMTSQTA